MTTYNEVNLEEKSSLRFTLYVKTSWAMHSAVQELSNQRRGSMLSTTRDLIAIGLENYKRELGPLELRKLKLFKALKEERERVEVLRALSELKDNMQEDEFLSLCRIHGVDPDKVPPRRGGNQKRDRCRNFLRVLFTDRSEGLPVKRVLEVGKSEGFGENLTRDVVRDMDFQQVWETIDGVRTSLWKPQEE